MKATDELRIGVRGKGILRGALMSIVVHALFTLVFQVIVSVFDDRIKAYLSSLVYMICLSWGLSKNNVLI